MTKPLEMALLDLCDRMARPAADDHLAHRLRAIVQSGRTFEEMTREDQELFCRLVSDAAKQEDHGARERPD